MRMSANEKKHLIACARKHIHERRTRYKTTQKDFLIDTNMIQRYKDVASYTIIALLTYILLIQNFHFLVLFLVTQILLKCQVSEYKLQSIAQFYRVYLR